MKLSWVILSYLDPEYELLDDASISKYSNKAGTGVILRVFVENILLLSGKMHFQI